MTYHLSNSVAKHLLTEDRKSLFKEQAGTAVKIRSPRISSWLCNRDIKHHISLHCTLVPCA